MTPPSKTAATGNRTIFSTPSDRELVITRTFDAPRSLVWAAFTDPKHLPNWQTGPKGFTMPVCEIDLRRGGSWHYVWRNAQGREFRATGTYREVTPQERIVAVASKNGEENTSTTVFTEHDGRTTVTTTMLFASKASRDQALPFAKGGTESSYARLDAYLASKRLTA
jgi:uncharacterized protein YndB with AHSA1/START domain